MEINLKKSAYATKAMDLFKEGYNCAQAVFFAFEDQYNIDKEIALRLSSSFGGGMGRLREVCGTVSGMFMVAGILYGYDDPKEIDGKKEHYERIQLLAKEFQNRNGSIICRELLAQGKRPCVELVGMAAAIMEQYIKEH